MNSEERATIEIAEAWARFIEDMRAANPVDEIARRLEAHDPRVLVGVENAAVAFSNSLIDSVILAAKARSAEMSEPGARVTFDAHDPNFVRAMANRRLRTIASIVQEVGNLEAQIRMRPRDATPTKTPAMLLTKAREFRAPDAESRGVAIKLSRSIGLTPEQERYVDNYRRELEQRNYSAARARVLHPNTARVEGAIESATRNDRTMTPTQIDNAVNAYRRNFERLRADTIARTEAQTAANLGDHEAMVQAVKDGKVDQDRIIRTWIAKKDRATRDTHRHMHGQERRGFDPFQSSSGVLLLFPGDPSAPIEEVINCRCRLKYKVAKR